MKSHPQSLLAIMRQLQTVTPHNWYLCPPTVYTQDHVDALQTRELVAQPEVMFVLNCVFEYEYVIEYGSCGAPS